LRELPQIQSIGEIERRQEKSKQDESVQADREKQLPELARMTRGTRLKQGLGEKVAFAERDRNDRAQPNGARLKMKASYGEIGRFCLGYRVRFDGHVRYLRLPQ
jgi:hypothetical protein